MSSITKKKKCGNKGCEREFYPYKSTDKFCSFSCAAKNTKPLKKTPLKKRAYTIRKKTKKAEVFDKEYRQSRIRVKDRVEDKFGRLCCENCGDEKSIQFSTHHIIYRSEKPHHPMLNHEKNLIYVCFDCHEWFHKRKKNRNPLITERKLWELFGEIWGYEKNKIKTK